MPRGRRRKIEVPTDTQPQFELGDTAEDIEGRRREKEERDEREREERTRGKGQREDGEREEGREPGKAQIASRRRTDVGCWSQGRQILPTLGRRWLANHYSC